MFNQNKILYITRHNPWGIGGGSMASRMYLSLFQRLFPNQIIDLCLSDQIKIENISDDINNSIQTNLIFVQSRSLLEKLMSCITGITHRYQSIGKKLLQTSEYSHVVFDHSSIAGSLLKYVPVTTKTITIHHNYEPAYYKDNTHSVIFKTIFLPHIKNLERCAFQKSNINLFLTKEDLSLFNKTYGQTSAQNLVSGLFEINNDNTFNPVHDLDRTNPTIIISGSLDNIQNIDGIKYFCNELYPFIPKNYKIVISGKNPDKEIFELIRGKDNIECIPNPIDMKDVVKKGNIYLSPARAGGGIKVRVTDGLKLGLPIIAHTTSARGYAEFINKGYFKSFSTPQSFKHNLLEIQKQIEEHTIQPKDIVELYKEKFSISRITELIKPYL